MGYHFTSVAGMDRITEAMARINFAVIPCAIFLFGMFLMVANAADLNAVRWGLVATEAVLGTLGLWMLCGARE